MRSPEKVKGFKEIGLAEKEQDPEYPPFWPEISIKVNKFEFDLFHPIKNARVGSGFRVGLYPIVVIGSVASRKKPPMESETPVSFKF